MNTYSMISIYKMLCDTAYEGRPYTIFVATDNKTKIEHYRNLFKVIGKLYGANLVIKTPEDMNIHLDVDEDGSCLEDNSEKKAYEYKCALYNAGYVMPVVADDSGLFIDELAGWPGIYTRRCAPEGQLETTFIEKCRDINDRSATYESAFTYISPSWNTIISAHTVRHGRVSQEIIGTEGNAVENVFIPEELFDTYKRDSMSREFSDHNIPFMVANNEESKDEFKTLGSRGMTIFRVAGHQIFDLLYMHSIVNNTDLFLVSELIGSLHDLSLSTSPMFNMSWDMFKGHIYNYTLNERW